MFACLTSFLFTFCLFFLLLFVFVVTDATDWHTHPSNMIWMSAHAAEHYLDPSANPKTNHSASWPKSPRTNLPHRVPKNSQCFECPNNERTEPNKSSSYVLFEPSRVHWMKWRNDEAFIQWDSLAVIPVHVHCTKFRTSTKRLHRSVKLHRSGIHRNPNPSLLLRIQIHAPLHPKRIDYWSENQLWRGVKVHLLTQQRSRVVRLLLQPVPILQVRGKHALNQSLRTEVNGSSSFFFSFSFLPFYLFFEHRGSRHWSPAWKLIDVCLPFVPDFVSLVIHTLTSYSLLSFPLCSFPSFRLWLRIPCTRFLFSL